MIAIVIGVMLGLYILTQMADLLLRTLDRGDQPLLLLLAGGTALVALVGVGILLNIASLSAGR